MKMSNRRRAVGAGVMTSVLVLGGALAGVPALASPEDTAGENDGAEQNFFSQLYLMGPLPLTAERTLQLGIQACRVRRTGGSTEDAKASLWKSLEAQGVLLANAQIGTLVHVAVDTLCPEVGYP